MVPPKFLSLNGPYAFLVAMSITNREDSFIGAESIAFRDLEEPVDELMTTEEFSAAARAPVSTIRYWRAQGIGPVGFKVGKRVLYRARDVQAWLDERRRAAARKASA